MTYISLVRCDKLTTVKINASGCCTINEVFRDRTVWATIGFRRIVRRALNSRQLGRLTGRVKFRGSRVAQFRLFPNVWNWRSWDLEIPRSLEVWILVSEFSILNPSMIEILYIRIFRIFKLWSFEYRESIVSESLVFEIISNADLTIFWLWIFSSYTWNLRYERFYTFRARNLERLL